MKRKTISLALILFLMLAFLGSCDSIDRVAPTNESMTPSGEYDTASAPIIEGKSPSVEYGTAIVISDVANVSNDCPGVELRFQQVSDENGSISEDGRSVTFAKAGEYSVVVVATDANGNSSEKECPISVIDATSPVIISITGADKIGYGETLTLISVSTTPSATNAIIVEYEDASDVSLSISSIQKVESEDSNEGFSQGNNNSVVFSQIGDYVLTIDVTDAFGNSSSSQANISVVDLTKPSIHGLDKITISDKDALPNFLDAVVATDEIDGDLTQSLIVDSSAVKKGVPGTYEVLYSVSDAAGNTVQAKRVVLIEDTTPPTLTISKSTITLTVGDKKPDYKSLVSAKDAVDGDVSSKVTIDDSAVNYSKAGTYDVKFTVKDSSGNSSTKILKLTVKAKIRVLQVAM